MFIDYNCIFNCQFLIYFKFKYLSWFFNIYYVYFTIYSISFYSKNALDIRFSIINYLNCLYLVKMSMKKCL